MQENSSVMKGIALTAVAMAISAFIVFNPQERKPVEPAAEIGPADVTNDPSVEIHFGDHVRFKHGFYKGVEGTIIAADDAGLLTVESSSKLNSYHRYDNSISKVSPETLELMELPTPAPDLDLFKEVR